MVTLQAILPLKGFYSFLRWFAEDNKGTIEEKD